MNHCESSLVTRLFMWFYYTLILAFVIVALPLVILGECMFGDDR